MALGTPVFGTNANSPTGEGSVNANYPTGILASDVVLLFVTQKPSVANAGTIVTPAGWTSRVENLHGGGYGATLGGGTGNTSVRVFSWDSPIEAQTGTLAVSLTNNSVTGAIMCRIPTGGSSVIFGSAIGSQDTTPTTSWSVTTTNGTPAPDFAVGDVVIWEAVTADNSGGTGWSAHGISAAGATFDTVTEAGEFGSGGGNDYGAVISYTTVTAGSSTTAPTLTSTLAGTLTERRGPIVLLKIGEALPRGPLAATETDSDDLSGVGTVLVEGSLAATETVTDAFVSYEGDLSGSMSATEEGSDTFASTDYRDYSWTATATGARKSAQAGYIDPVYFVGSPYNHKGAAIFEVSTAGNVDFYVERVLGETGSISTTISTFDVLTGGARAGTHYTAVSQVVTYTDGEIGWKKVTIPVTAIPTGFGVIGLQLSNYIPDGTGTARNEFCYIFLQGTGHVAGAKYLLSLGAGIDSSANTDGDGTIGNPWRSPSHAATQMGNGGGVLYVSSANGNYADDGSFKETNNNKLGAFVFENLCTVTNPLICLPHPDNITPVVVDNGLGANYSANPYFPGGYSEYLSKAGGISVGRFASHVWIVGINAVHGGIGASAYTYNAVHHIVLWKLSSHYVAMEGSNVHNIRFDSSYDCIFDSCTYGEAYTYQNNNMAIWPSNTTPFVGQVIPMAQSGSIQSFHSYGMRVIGCTSDNTEYGVFQKNAPGNQGVNVGYFTYTVKHCLFKRTKSAAVYLTNAGNGSPPTLKAVVGYCVSDGNTREGVGSQVSMVSINMDGPASAQSDRVDVYNCINRNNSFIGNLDCDHVRYWNNISEDANGGQYGAAGNGSFDSRLEYGDHCLYVRGSQYRNTENFTPQEIEYPTLEAWQAVNVPVTGTTDIMVLMEAPDANSVVSTITPSYTNAAAFDYRYNNTLGYAGKAVGLDFMEVGAEIIYDTLYVIENGQDTFASTGTVGSNVLDATESGTDTLASTGTVLVAGSLAVTEAATDTFAGDDNVDGSLAVTEASSDTLASTGTVLVSGSMAATEATTDTMGAIAGTNLFTLPKNTVVKVAKGGSTFKAINLSTYQVRIKYSTTVPAITDNDWGILRGRKKELSLGLGMDLYAYSEFGGVLLVVSTDSIT